MAILIPNELKAFHKVFESLCYSRDAGELFDTFLEFIVSGFCADGTIIFQPSKGYKPKELQQIGELYKEYVLVMDKMVSDNSWYDLFGTYYESFVAGKSRRDSRGQFFTPCHICDLMTQISSDGENNYGKGMNVSDPTCGSGRTLLSFHVNNGYGNYLCGEDIDRTCCLMTVCNFLIHGVVGEVVWHDSLQPNTWNYGWKINANLNNPFHKHHGIPHIETLQKESSRVYTHWETIRQSMQENAKQPGKEPEKPKKAVKQEYGQLTLF